MTKRRTPTDIVADILKIADSGARITKLVYQGNLNFKVVKPYLDKLVTKGYLVMLEDGRTWITTNDGKRFLEAYDNLEAFLEEEAATFGEPSAA